MRQPTPQRRRCDTFKRKVDGHKLFVNIGFYDDGRPCEIFVDYQRAGSDMNVLLGMFGMTASVALQCGAEPRELISLWRAATATSYAGTEPLTESYFSVIADVMEEALEVPALWPDQVAKEIL